MSKALTHDVTDEFVVGERTAQRMSHQFADQLHISTPEEGVMVSIGDVMILGHVVQRFEDAHNLFDRIAAGAGLGEDGDYDWAGMHVEITRRVFKEGLPVLQTDWIRAFQDWLEAQRGSLPA